MARILFQIGDFAVWNHYIASQVASVSIDNPVSWRIASTVLSGVSGQYIAGSYERPLMSPQSYKTSGSFMTEKGMTKDQKVAKLMSLGGRPGIPIIAFEYDDCEHDGITCGCNPSLNWVIATGTITNVGRKINILEHEEPHTGDFTEMDMDITLQSPWRRLTPWVWEFRKDRVNNPFITTNATEVGNNTFPHPAKMASLQQQGFFYKWADDLIRYSPDYWAVKYSAGISGGFGQNYLTTPYNNDLIIPFETWNGNPTATYAITNLQSSGTVKICVTYQNGLFFGQTAVQESSLDLAVASAALSALGYGLLLPNDVIIAGRVSPFPSFVIRDTQVIPNFIPKWAFSGIYPGELFPTANRLEFINDGANARYAYLVDYGAY